MFLRNFLRSFLFLTVFVSQARSEPLELYIDADYSVSHLAAEAIQLGVETALSEVDFQLGGMDVRVVPMDHRGNVKRSYRNMRTFLASDTALSIIGGMHSPSYLAYRDFMNDNRMLTLLPWAAAGPITRATDGAENWVFRLSVDDDKSGEYLIKEAVDRHDCQFTALLLVDTGWGRAIHSSLTNALAERGKTAVSVHFFPVTLRNATAQTVAQSIRSSNADCVILLADWNNGAALTNALHTSTGEQPLRVFSHWGITGGRFQEAVPYQILQGLQVLVLQTCGLRRENEGSVVLSNALKNTNLGVASLTEITAPTGFVHGYDVTRILISAANQAAQNSAWPSAHIKLRRTLVRQALLNLEDPVQGILKSYEPPFSAYGPTNRDGHEALGPDDLCMARFTSGGSLEDAR